MIQIPCGAGGGHAEVDTVEESGVGYTLSLIGGKYKMVILYWLYRKPVIRFNELQRLIGGVSYKTLSATLKELERDELVTRTEYPQIPPKVEYQLSDIGRSLIPVLDAMCVWGNRRRAEVSEHHRASSQGDGQISDERSMAEVLASMPNVGRDEDFER